MSHGRSRTYHHTFIQFPITATSEDIYIYIYPETFHYFVSFFECLASNSVTQIMHKSCSALTLTFSRSTHSFLHFSINKHIRTTFTVFVLKTETCHIALHSRHQFKLRGRSTPVRASSLSSYGHSAIYRPQNSYLKNIIYKRNNNMIRFSSCRIMYDERELTSCEQPSTHIVPLGRGLLDAFLSLGLVGLNKFPKPRRDNVCEVA